MKTLIFTTLLLSLTYLGFSQEGTITIEQNPKIEALVAIYKDAKDDSGYYQIQVGFTTSDSAAQRLLNEIEVAFPGWYSTIKFNEPTFRIRLGRFKTKMEAQRRLIRVRKKYPNAFLLPQKVGA